MADWYRRKTWSKDDESDFLSRLDRARKRSRAQYLRIQATELLETEEPENIEAARSLLERVLTEYPENTSERSSAFYSLGDVSRFKGDNVRALSYYRAAVDFEAENPSVQTNAFLSYSELIVKDEHRENYDFVEQLIHSRTPHMILPIQKYKAFSILSIIYRQKMDLEKAEYYAALADQNAALENSGFRYHKDLGLVEKRDADLDRLVSGI
ncbi:MAG TPA: hypothetical protein VG101_13090 [Puia sp.]|jgi:hypothetical protein|nr:hypothetical protein [Puia sp.]